jgi:hypothetical protein
MSRTQQVHLHPTTLPTSTLTRIYSHDRPISLIFITTPNTTKNPIKNTPMYTTSNTTTDVNKLEDQETPLPTTPSNSPQNNTPNYHFSPLHPTQIATRIH